MSWLVIQFVDHLPRFDESCIVWGPQKIDTDIYKNMKISMWNYFYWSWFSQKSGLFSLRSCPLVSFNLSQPKWSRSQLWTPHLFHRLIKGQDLFFNLCHYDFKRDERINKAKLKEENIIMCSFTSDLWILQFQF